MYLAISNMNKNRNMPYCVLTVYKLNYTARLPTHWSSPYFERMLLSEASILAFISEGFSLHTILLASYWHGLTSRPPSTVECQTGALLNIKKIPIPRGAIG